MVLIIAGGIWSWSLSSFFLKRANLLDLVTPYVFIGLLAFGLTFVVIAGEIDISVVSTMAVSAVVFAQIWKHGREHLARGSSPRSSVAAALGLVNGLLSACSNLPSLAVTLGTLAAYRGLAYVILGGESDRRLPERSSRTSEAATSERAADRAARARSDSRVVLGILLHATRFGRYVYAIGSNREARATRACRSRASA